MAQQKKTPQHKQQSLDDLRNSTTSKSSGGIPVKFRTPIAIITLFAAILLFFAGALPKGKTLNASDNAASESIFHYLKAAQADGVDVPQWIPNIFCGMPSFAALLSTGKRSYDLVHGAFDVIRDIPVAVFGGNDVLIHIWDYFIFGMGMYLLMRFGRRTSHLVALFVGFSAMFSTWIMTYSMIGHNTKVFAVMCFPYILLSIEKLREEKQPWQLMLFWGSVLAIAFHFLLESTHVQMVFYQLLAVLIYFIVWLVSDLIAKRNLVGVFRTGILALLMIGTAFAMSADRYLATLGYDPYSIRGASPLVDRSELQGNNSQKQAPVKNTSATGGLDWNYATEYSFSPAEMITFIVPGWYGFGRMPYDGPEVQPGAKVPTYWGQMTTTDAANYTGSIVFFLALIGICTLKKKDRLILPLAIISGFGLLLSFGSTFSLLYKPMFYYFPTFNKFRAPMMALVLMQMCFPILAGLTLQQIIEVVKHQDEKVLKSRLTAFTGYAMYAAAGLFVIFLLGRSILESSLRSGLAASNKAIVNYPDALKETAINVGLNDALVCTLIAALALAALWMYLRGKIANALIPVSVVLGLTVIDLWRVDSRPLEITSTGDYQETFRTHDYVEFIKQDKSLYRVFDVTEPTSNVPVSWGLQTISGYSAAKVRAYQDIVDITGNTGGSVIFNPFVWSLFNTKYVIANGAVDSVQGRMTPVFISKEQAQGRDGKPQQTVVWKNNAVLPRAFFVRGFEVKPPIEFLTLMRDGSFNPRDVMFFDKQPEGIGTTSEDPIDSGETVEITKYMNETVEMKVNAKANRLLFMSDTYHADWEATLDGKTPIKIYKADWAFRALAVPAGQHTITLNFRDHKYESGKTISLATNILAIIGLALGIGIMMRKKKEKIA